LTLWPAGYRRKDYAELDSTNEEARRLAEAGEAGPLWLMAAQQTAGRGRRGRAWDTAAGNLAATLLLRPQAPQAIRGQLSFAAALAAAETVQHFAPAAGVTVKWPNDVLAGGRKIAGLLLEGSNDWLAIGIGINLAHHPDGTAFPATSLPQLGIAPPSCDAALTVLAARFAHWYDAWMEKGFEVLRQAWLGRASGVGAPITARLPHETRQGVFEGIDASGALLLKEENGVRAIAAGEVFF
jgi:BirA family biotin operon repressor/biotin-[acetyl-CoA-carboxylase] ligase